MTAKLPIFIILVFLFTGCFSTIKPSKQIDDNNDEIFELADSLSDCEGDISEFELMVYAEHDKRFGPYT